MGAPDPLEPKSTASHRSDPIRSIRSKETRHTSWAQIGSPEVAAVEAKVTSELSVDARCRRGDEGQFAPIGESGI